MKESLSPVEALQREIEFQSDYDWNDNFSERSQLILIAALKLAKADAELQAHLRTNMDSDMMSWHNAREIIMRSCELARTELRNALQR